MFNCECNSNQASTAKELLSRHQLGDTVTKYAYAFTGQFNFPVQLPASSFANTISQRLKLHGYLPFRPRRLHTHFLGPTTLPAGMAQLLSPSTLR